MSPAEPILLPNRSTRMLKDSDPQTASDSRQTCADNGILQHSTMDSSSREEGARRTGERGRTGVEVLKYSVIYLLFSLFLPTFRRFSGSESFNGAVEGLLNDSTRRRDCSRGPALGANGRACQRVAALATGAGLADQPAFRPEASQGEGAQREHEAPGGEGEDGDPSGPDSLEAEFPPACEPTVAFFPWHHTPTNECWSGRIDRKLIRFEIHASRFRCKCDLGATCPNVQARSPDRGSEHHNGGDGTCHSAWPAKCRKQPVEPASHGARAYREIARGHESCKLHGSSRSHFNRHPPGEQSQYRVALVGETDPRRKELQTGVAPCR